jgi:hypothetical protein
VLVLGLSRIEHEQEEEQEGVIMGPTTAAGAEEE